jgi:hypothetical protein
VEQKTWQGLAWRAPAERVFRQKQSACGLAAGVSGGGGPSPLAHHAPVAAREVRAADLRKNARQGLVHYANHRTSSERFVLNLWAIGPTVHASECRQVKSRQRVWWRCAFSRHHRSRPAGIDPARGLPWRAGTLTHTLARSPPARGVLLLFLPPRPQGFAPCASFHPPPRGLSL